MRGGKNGNSIEKTKIRRQTSNVRVIDVENFALFDGVYTQDQTAAMPNKTSRHIG